VSYDFRKKYNRVAALSSDGVYDIPDEYAKILSRNEERALGKRILAGRTPYLRPIGIHKSKKCTDYKFTKDAKRAIQKLVSHNIRLVKSVSCKYPDNGMSSEDLTGYGCQGLMVAAAKWDYRIAKFGTYATWWVRQAIVKALIDHCHLIRIPAFSYASKKSKQATEDLKRTVAAASDSARGINFVFRDGEEGSDRYEDTSSPRPEDEVMSEEVRAILKRCLKRLDLRERSIIELRAMSEVPMTLDELGEKFGLSKERVRQIEMECVGKMHRYVASRYPEYLVD
jgi:RNA polymerase primary sigma factor